MADFADYAETEIRDWMSQGTDPDTAPSNLHVALHTGAPGDDAASNEVSAGDYSRVSTTTGTDWDTPASDNFENASEISFGTATSNWGTVTAVSLWDSSTGGNALAAYSLDTSRTINDGDEARFPAGDLSFSID